VDPQLLVAEERGLEPDQRAGDLGHDRGVRDVPSEELAHEARLLRRMDQAEASPVSREDADGEVHQLPVLHQQRTAPRGAQAIGTGSEGRGLPAPEPAEHPERPALVLDDEALGRIELHVSR
jgi:hypothetical protein